MRAQLSDPAFCLIEPVFPLTFSFSFTHLPAIFRYQCYYAEGAFQLILLGNLSLPCVLLISAFPIVMLPELVGYI